MNTHLSRTKRVTREVGVVRRASCLRNRALLALALAGFALTAGAARLDAQVYGVARRTTVVAAARPVGLPAGYIAVLPAGYTVVGGGVFMAGGTRYRARMYQGRTVYVRI